MVFGQPLSCFSCGHAVCVLILFANGFGKNVGPRHLATKGQVWPKAWKEHKTANVYKVDPDKLKYTIIGKDCHKIQSAIQRCKDNVKILKDITKRHTEEYSLHNAHGSLEELKIELGQDCEDFPHLNMDESYSLQVSSSAVLNSSSVWGIIRGMETFSQLFYLAKDYKTILINGTVVNDKPNYPHRALMLDTGRHYLSVKNILKTLDAMAMNKMNVFHWHIVDDESFPYESLKLPEFSKALFHPSLVYKRSDLEKISSYAKDLGIRVLMEFDMPGHVSSWKLVHPEIITKCKNHGMFSPPLNPINKKTFEILKELIQEVQELFPDTYFHFGGDEVNTGCYKQDPEIKKYMKKHYITDEHFIHAMFYVSAFSLLKNGTFPVVWEDVFESNVPLPEKSSIQVWRVDDGIDGMVKVLKAGYYGIQSAPYYLNILGHDIENWFYQKEPRLAVKEKLNNDTLLVNLIGGTACMWGEMVNDNNLLSRVWPRASAIAEVLWSETKGERPDEGTLRRIEEHTCRMNRRGIPAEPPAGPGFCFV